MALGHPPLGAGRCASCGAVASKCEEHLVTILSNDDPACPRRQHVRERTPSSPEIKGVQCRRCSESITVDQDTPKLGRKFLASPRSQTSALVRARGVMLAIVMPLLAMHLLVCVVLASREWRQRWAPSASGAAPGSAGGIPKIIHQMYKSSELPDKWRDVPATWASHHPPGEYTYMLWTDEDLRSLIEKDYPWLLPTYDGYPFPTQRWDASRYAVLHKCV